MRAQAEKACLDLDKAVDVPAHASDSVVEQERLGEPTIEYASVSGVCGRSRVPPSAAVRRLVPRPRRSGRRGSRTRGRS